MVGVKLAGDDTIVTAWAPVLTLSGPVYKAEFDTDLTWHAFTGDGPTKLVAFVYADLLAEDVTVAFCQAIFAQR
jgi:hypothetical protein